MRHRIGRNQKGFVGAIKDSFKEVTTMRFLKRSGQVAAGSVFTPITSGILTGIISKFSPVKTDSGAFAFVIDIASAAVTAGAASLVTKNPEAIANVLLGGVSGKISEVASDTLLPAIGLGEYFSAQDIPQLSDFVTTDQLAQAERAGTFGEGF